MIGKYIKQFMDDNELSVDEEFGIKNKDGQKVFLNNNGSFRISDINGGMLTSVLGITDGPPIKLLDAALVELLRENYFVEKKPFCPSFGERYYYIAPTGVVMNSIFNGVAEDFLLYKYIGVYKTEEAAIKNVSRCLKFWEEVKRK
ncbi:hypothetical protein [Phascolarctobacterium faecium]|uniref:hypothetical protein n=1 Tax=Phascolarctobacterium faecium TaxID=33025 RepID=UPI002E8E0E7A|nr:hypothetical protein [Phascolarctobacterium faecium]